MKIEQVYAITWIPATNDVIMIGKAESGQYVLGQRYSDVMMSLSLAGFPDKDKFLKKGRAYYEPDFESMIGSLTYIIYRTVEEIAGEGQ